MRGIIFNVAGGLELNEDGRRLIARGGADGVSDDEMLMLEIVHRAPNMTLADLQGTFIALGEQYGDDALKAIRAGHVKFERQKGIGNG